MFAAPPTARETFFRESQYSCCVASQKPQPAADTSLIVSPCVSVRSASFKLTLIWFAAPIISATGFSSGGGLLSQRRTKGKEDKNCPLTHFFTSLSRCDGVGRRSVLRVNGSSSAVGISRFAGKSRPSLWRLGGLIAVDPNYRSVPQPFEATDLPVQLFQVCATWSWFLLSVVRFVCLVCWHQSP